MAGGVTPSRRDEQVLLVADEGRAASLVEAALVARGYGVDRAALEEPDLFSCALGRQAIVFVPTSNLLSAQLANCAGGDAVQGVLRAARAPGIQLVVAVLPEAPSFDSVVDAIAGDGKPYVIARTPGLMEEVAETLMQGDGRGERHRDQTLWLPRSGRVHIARGSALADAVANALETEEQGRVVRVPSESFDVASLFTAASDASGGQVRVRAVAPVVYRMVRPVARWLKGGEPAPLAFADQLLAREAAQSRAAQSRAAQSRAAQNHSSALAS